MSGLQIIGTRRSRTVANRLTPQLDIAATPLPPDLWHIMHLPQIPRRIKDQQRHLHLLPRLLISLLPLALLSSTRLIIRTSPRNTLGVAKLMSIMIPCMVLLELLHTPLTAAFDAREIRLTPICAAHALDHRGRDVCREEGPVVVGYARAGFVEDAELLKGGHDVENDCGLDVVAGLVVDEEAVADSAASVVAAPDYWTGFAEDALERFDEEVADCAFVGGRGEGGEAVAGEFGDKQGDGIFDQRDDLGLGLVGVEEVPRTNGRGATCPKVSIARVRSDSLHEFCHYM